MLTLKQRGEANAVELATSLFVTVSAIRQHLGRLTGEGLIAYREVGQGPGRRRRLYHLTPAAESLFPNGYEELLTRLMSFVLREDPVLLERFSDEEMQWRFERARRGASAPTFDGQVEAVVQTFTRDAFLPELDGQKGDELQFQHCPVLAAARLYPRLCAAELEFIQQLVPGGTVDRVAWRLDGAGVCAYRFTRAADHP